MDSSKPHIKDVWLPSNLVSFITQLPFILIFTIVAWYIWHVNGTFKNQEDRKLDGKQKKALRSINFHFTRQCNYQCGFCFHTAKTSHVLPFEKMKKGLKTLASKGMKKLNLSGGEPFLHPALMGRILRYCKEELHLESVSIVSNGSMIKENFFQKYAQYLDLLAISVDSFNEETNVLIGRGKGDHLPQMRKVADWCKKYNVQLRLNTVVNIYNWEEDFNREIRLLAPKRWKCFQVLLVDTENAGAEAIRNAQRYLITDEQFEAFCGRHKEQKCLIQESNRVMKSSYVILDEYMRFLNKGDNYEESASILDVPLDEAMAGIDFDELAFAERRGLYDWSKLSSTTCDKGQFDW